MKQDKLEQFIRDHRGDFDDEMPDPALFGRIARRDPLIVRLGRYKALWRAAAAIAIFVSSYYFHEFVTYRNQPAQAKAETETIEPSETIKMMLEAEAFYAAQINQRQQELYLLAQDQPEIKKEVSYEISELDTIYAELQRDLKDNAANEEVIEAMIQNYRFKLDILESVLQQLRAAKNEQTETTRQNDINL